MSAPSVGSIVMLWTHLSGVSRPPAGEYIELTAGLTGSGDYNAGLLTSESVSGSAPLVVATAQIAAGPMTGQTVHLVNTERRFWRAGVAGTTQNDQFQDHTHGVSFNMRGRNTDPKSAGPFNVRGTTTGTVTVGNATNAAGFGTIRTGTETRPKNIGATMFMRIL